MGFDPKTCPGVAKFVRPIPQYVKCPQCTSTLEIWSDEQYGKCENCGHQFPKFLSDASCLEWCPYADRCREMIAALQKG